MPVTNASESKDKDFVNGLSVELGRSDYVQAQLAAHQQHRLKVENKFTQAVTYEITMDGKKVQGW